MAVGTLCGAGRFSVVIVDVFNLPVRAVMDVRVSSREECPLPAGSASIELQT